MEIIYGFEKLGHQKSSIITLGTFDGLHLGHKKIIDTVITLAQKNNKNSVLITFEPHPRIILNKISGDHIFLLSTLKEKLNLLDALGIDKTIVVSFDQGFAKQDYKEFVSKTLMAKVGMEHLVIGYDHKFGKNREGDSENLKQLALNFNFSLSSVEPYYIDNQPISSTLIRNLLLIGKVEEAARYLGHPYEISGTVIHGDGRGKTLSFPTANLKPLENNKIIPKDGVYAVDVLLFGKKMKAMMNIGSRPTFKMAGFVPEVHIFDLNENIYDQTVTVYFKKRLRDEMKFSSAEQLIKQLKIDKKQSLKI